MQKHKVSYTPDDRVVWPFPSINGQQTPESKALEGDKRQHKPEQPNIDDMEESPW